MLACASLLGDLFPAAWPPSGAARPGQGSHPPPAHMRYRAALAKSFEPLTQEALRKLMACAAASESLIFRAALVRLCARASGVNRHIVHSLCDPRCSDTWMMASGSANGRLFRILRTRHLQVQWW